MGMFKGWVERPTKKKQELKVRNGGQALREKYHHRIQGSIIEFGRECDKQY